MAIADTMVIDLYHLPDQIQPSESENGHIHTVLVVIAKLPVLLSCNLFFVQGRGKRQTERHAWRYFSGTRRLHQDAGGLHANAKVTSKPHFICTGALFMKSFCL